MEEACQRISMRTDKALYSAREEDQISGTYPGSAISLLTLTRDPLTLFPGRMEALLGQRSGVPQRLMTAVDLDGEVQHGSTATGVDAGGFAGTRADGDLRVWTWVDVVPVVCKQGVRGSSPLSSTGQRHNSNSRGREYSSKVPQPGSHGVPHRRSSGASPSRAAAAQECADPRFWAEVQALSSKNAIGMVLGRLPGGQRKTL